MARPQKVGLQYFPLAVDFYTDERLMAAHKLFGNDGDMVVLHLLCAIYRSGYHVRWTEVLRLKIATLTDLEPEKVEEIVQKLAAWEYFDAATLQQHGVLTSEDIQQTYFEVAKRRRVQPDACPYLLIDLPAPKAPAQPRQKAKAAQAAAAAAPQPAPAPAQTASAAAPAPPAPSAPPENKDEPPAIETLGEAMKADSAWRAEFCRSLGVDNEVVPPRIDDWMQHCRCYDKHPADVTAAKRYFYDWLRYQIRKGSNISKSNNYGRDNDTDADTDFGIILPNGRRYIGFEEQTTILPGAIVPGCGLIE